MGSCQSTPETASSGPPASVPPPHREIPQAKAPVKTKAQAGGLLGISNNKKEHATPKSVSMRANQGLKGAELTPVNCIRNLTDGRPLNASDITDFHEAKREIKYLRKFAAEFLASVEGDSDDKDGKDEHAITRGALYDKHDFSSFKKQVYEKSDEVRSIIYDAIKPNVLFEHDTKFEILQIIDAFKPTSFKKGEVVINQGDEGSDFFVVESGELSIHVNVKGEGGEEDSKVKVGDYYSGMAFGELALIFGSPRAATITATADCKLWSIERLAYRSVISQLRYEQHCEKNAFIKTCEVNNKRFPEIFDGSQLEDLTIATKVDTYEEGDVILREGEKGETFYIVKSGRVETYTKQDGDKVHTVIDQKKSFGTTGLVKGTPSSFTYKAMTPVTVYYLTKTDFELIMGPLKDALDGNTIAQGRLTAKSESKRSFKTSMSMEQRYEIGLDDLDHFKVLGRGAFGQVTLVQEKNLKKVFALKAQSKHYIAKKSQREHVLNEYRIMKELEHPQILGIHCAMQDEKFLYFLLDLLPGGELMPYLVKRTRQGKGFAEDETRFYAATVVNAFEQLHSVMIAYRDLKPENIVLNKNGYGVLVDFGLAKEIDEGQTYTFCGTPDYLAPEIIRGTGHDWAVDYWGLGVFLFEMTNGTAPFYAANQARRTRKILKGYGFVNVPGHFSGGLSDLLSCLLVSDQSKRLGRTLNGIQGIKNHRWFAGFDWGGFSKCTLKAPIQPDIPEDIKTLGKDKSEKNPFQDASYAPDSDWWPDLKNLEEW